MKKSSVLYLGVFVLLAVIAVFIVRPYVGMQKISRTEFLMDTIVDGIVHAKDSRSGEEVLNLAYREMARLEGLLDRHTAGSEVTAINQAAGKNALTVSIETLDVIEKSLQVAADTGGAFDITIAPLLTLWSFGTADVRVPSAEEIAETRKLVDYRQVQVNNNNSTVFLEMEGAELDLGGIAKGYIVDRAVDLLLSHGITSAYLDAGGDIRVIGSKPDGSAWRIGVRHPRDRRDIIAVVELRDRAVVTSGDYERFFVADDVRYHHIIDPETGMPARGLTSVTVTAPDAFTADAYSTALFVLGLEKGMEIIEAIPELDAIMITEDEEVHISSGLLGKVEVRQ